MNQVDSKAYIKSSQSRSKKHARSRQRRVVVQLAPVQYDCKVDMVTDDKSNFVYLRPVLCRAIDDCPVPALAVVERGLQPADFASPSGEFRNDMTLQERTQATSTRAQQRFLR